MKPFGSIEGSSARPRCWSRRFQIFVWTLFDFANTSFSVLILTVAYSLYFTTVVTGGMAESDFLWGASFSISMLITATISPFLGAIADHSAGKKRFLLAFTLLCIVATSMLYFVYAGMVVLGMILLILANIGFEAGLVFYDSFLPEITTPRSYGRVSGYGYAMGYLGSFATLVLAYPFLRGEFAPENLLNVRLSFVMAGMFFLVFSAPLFLVLPDTRKAINRTDSYFRIGVERVRATVTHLRRYRNIANFLLSFFIYIDGVNTVIVFASIFARRVLHFTLVEILVFFVAVQSTAIVGSVLFGILADHFGQKRTLSTTLLLWIAVVVIAFFVNDKGTFYLVGFMAGAAMGSSQSTSRSLMSRIVPPEKRTEFFGYYSFFGKSSAIVGPFIFGVLASLWSERVAVISVGLFFVIGVLLLQRVKDEPYQSEPESRLVRH